MITLHHRVPTFRQRKKQRNTVVCCTEMTLNNYNNNRDLLYLKLERWGYLSAWLWLRLRRREYIWFDFDFDFAALIHLTWLWLWLRRASTSDLTLTWLASHSAWPKMTLDSWLLTLCLNPNPNPQHRDVGAYAKPRAQSCGGIGIDYNTYEDPKTARQQFCDGE